MRSSVGSHPSSPVRETHQRAAGQVARLGHLDVAGLTGHGDHHLAHGLEQPGVVSGVGLIGVRLSQYGGPERLGCLHGDQRRAVHRGHHGGARHLLHRVGHRQHRHGAGRPVRTGDGRDHLFEQCRGGQRAHGVVHDHDVDLVGHGGQTGTYRAGPGGTPLDDRIGQVAEGGNLAAPTQGIGRDHDDHSVDGLPGRRRRPVEHGTPVDLRELLGAAEPVAGPSGHHHRPHHLVAPARGVPVPVAVPVTVRRRPVRAVSAGCAQGRASSRRSSAVSSSTPRAKVSSETSIWRARLSMRFSPADSPLSLSRIDRFRTTSATW